MTRGAMRDVEPAATAGPDADTGPVALAAPAAAAGTGVMGGVDRAPREQIKILFLAANGADRDLRLDDEYRAVDSATGHRADSFALVSKWSLQRDELQQGLLQHQPDIVHFGG